jgi:hypothetical protein
MTSKLKAVFDLVIGAIVKHLGMSGFSGWLAKMAMKYGGQALCDLALDAWRKIQRKWIQQEAEQKKDEIVNKPDASADEVGKAYEDYFNAGRKKND